MKAYEQVQICFIDLSTEDVVRTSQFDPSKNDKEKWEGVDYGF